ncbi:MAG: tetratricopeptide repeat-containing glycosyltransferase family protein, partial [Pirellulales bacterium]
AQFIFEQILKASPEEPGALNGLGVIAFRADRVDEAEDYYDRAIAEFPGNPAYLNNLNLVYCRQGRLAEAVECCRRALALEPRSARLHNNLGIALKLCGQLEPALESFRRALALEPDYADAHFNLANALVQLGMLDEAADAFRRAIELAPGDADANYNRALLDLLRGNFQEGWPGLEWRWGLKGFSRPNFDAPRWQGQPLEGRTVLLVGEQGLGDVIQMIRFANTLKRSAATVLVECKPTLQALLKTAPGIDRFVNPGEAQREAFDFYVPLLSLPGALGTTLETIPAEVPYLFAEPGRIEHWRRELSGSSEFKVGIAWQGRPTYALDAFRSIPLAEFAPLAECPRVRLFALQKGHGREQLESLDGKLPIVDLAASLDLGSDAFVDTAAVMMNLDLVITSDTSMAHLAGALGVDVWVALAQVPDWRWLLDRQHSPWYPTMRLFRQPRLGDWADVFAQMAGPLQLLADGER